jgi:hypothetical protein
VADGLTLLWSLLSGTWVPMLSVGAFPGWTVMLSLDESCAHPSGAKATTPTAIAIRCFFIAFSPILLNLAPTVSEPSCVLR